MNEQMININILIKWSTSPQGSLLAHKRWKKRQRGYMYMGKQSHVPCTCKWAPTAKPHHVPLVFFFLFLLTQSRKTDEIGLLAPLPLKANPLLVICFSWPLSLSLAGIKTDSFSTTTLQMIFFILHLILNACSVRKFHNNFSLNVKFLISVYCTTREKKKKDWKRK